MQTKDSSDVCPIRVELEITASLPNLNPQDIKDIVDEVILEYEKMVERGIKPDKAKLECIEICECMSQELNKTKKKLQP
jgi:hypothetical protein